MRACGFFVVTYVAIQAASGAPISYPGSLAASSDSSTTITVNLASAGNLALQTWGFGGGTNAASVVIPAGGFDPFVGVFAGQGSTATFVDGASAALSNYQPFPGGPPAASGQIGA